MGVGGRKSLGGKGRGQGDWGDRGNGQVLPAVLGALVRGGGRMRALPFPLQEILLLFFQIQLCDFQGEKPQAK